MSSKRKVVTLFIFIISKLLIAQVGIGTTTPDDSAVLDVTSSDKGVLIPRVALLAANNGTLPISNPENSLLVYNTATASSSPNEVTPGFYYWSNFKWNKLNQSTDLDLRSKGNGNHLTKDAGQNNNGSSLGTGSDNIAIGLNSFSSLTTGSRNIGLGSGSGFLSTNANDNIFIGTNSGSSPEITGSNNILIGSSTSVLDPSKSNQTSINDMLFLNNNGDMSLTSILPNYAFSAPLSRFTIYPHAPGSTTPMLFLINDNCGGDCGQGLARHITMRNNNPNTPHQPGIFGSINFVAKTTGLEEAVSLRTIDRNPFSNLGGIEIATRDNATSVSPKFKVRSNGRIEFPKYTTDFNSVSNDVVMFMSPSTGALTKSNITLNELTSNAITTITNNTTLTASNKTVLVNNNNPIAITLPAPTSGKIINIKKTSSNTHNIEVNTPGTGTIDGLQTKNINIVWKALQLQSDGTDWFIINQL